jgi:hypothetical protein
MNKLEVARRQLGTALALYLEDLDPVSVHSLASAACELLEHLAAKAGKKPLNHFILPAFPNYGPADLRRIQHEFWNAFKHALRPDQKTERNDALVLETFSDADNDHRLFVAWYDYANAAQRLPLEASLFLIWYQCLYPEDVGIHLPSGMIDNFFPNLPAYDRATQKQALKTTIEAHRKFVSSDDPIIEHRSLILPR